MFDTSRCLRDEFAARASARALPAFFVHKLLFLIFRDVNAPLAPRPSASSFANLGA